MKIGEVDYRIVEARPARWWRRATFYVDTNYGRMGPMPRAEAEAVFALLWAAHR